MDVATQLSTIPNSNDIIQLQSDVIQSLAAACSSADVASITECLLRDDFKINDNIYRHTFPGNDLLMNDSACILRSAVSGGAPSVVRLLLLETAPGAVIDPAAMNNIALQDAILSGKGSILSGSSAMVHVLGNDVRVVCSAKYSSSKLWNLHDFYDADWDNYIVNGADILSSDSTPLAIEVLRSDRFRQLMSLTLEELLPMVERDVVRLTRLHVALLVCFRETKEKHFAQALSLASGLKERQMKDRW